MAVSIPPMALEDPVDVTADPELAELADISESIRIGERMVPVRDRKIREMKAKGYSVAQLIAAAGISDARVYQILGPTRPRKAPSSE